MDDDDEFFFVTNCTYTSIFFLFISPFDQPPSRVFLKNLEPVYIVMLSIASALMLSILVLALMQWYCVWSYVGVERRRNLLYFLLALFPFASGCSLVSMYVPRTSLLLTSFGVLYFMLCLFAVVSLLQDLFGGRAAMAAHLEFHDHGINFQNLPLCCCCCFLPQATSSERNLRRIEWFVLQAPVIRTVIVASNMVAIAELRSKAAIWLRISEIIAVGSLLPAIFGCHTLARLAREKLDRSYRFSVIFRIVDFSLLLFTAQQIIYDILTFFHAFSCGPYLTPSDKSRFFNSFTVICEMFTLSLLACYLLSPAQNAIFDKYPSRRESKLTLNVTEQTMLTPAESTNVSV
jgi:organic solute transporter subunit alpha